MSITSEADVKREVKKVLNKEAPDVWYYMPVSNGMGKHGIPDFIICAYGYFFAIETKYNGSKPTKYQRIQLDAIHRAGGIALVIDECNFELVQHTLDAIYARENASIR